MTPTCGLRLLCEQLLGVPDEAGVMEEAKPVTRLSSEQGTKGDGCLGMVAQSFDSVEVIFN